MVLRAGFSAVNTSVAPHAWNRIPILRSPALSLATADWIINCCTESQLQLNVSEVVANDRISSVQPRRVQLKCDGTRWRREGKWRGNWRITTADAHTSAVSSRLNWRPRRFKWTRPIRRKTKSGFCACAITFQTQSTALHFPLCCLAHTVHPTLLLLLQASPSPVDTSALTFRGLFTSF